MRDRRGRKSIRILLSVHEIRDRDEPGKLVGTIYKRDYGGMAASVLLGLRCRRQLNRGYITAGQPRLRLQLSLDGGKPQQEAASFIGEAHAGRQRPAGWSATTAPCELVGR